MTTQTIRRSSGDAGIQFGVRARHPVRRFIRQPGIWLSSVAFLLTLTACQSGLVRQDSATSELATGIEPSPFLLRKLAPGSTAQASKLLPTASALQPDPMTPLLPCGDGDYALRDLAVKSVSLSYQDVDAPAAQVYIEGWVLEVSEEDSRELGIRYAENIRDDASITLGDIDGEGDTIDFTSDNRIDVDGEFLFRPEIGVLKRVRALVENGKAEILSRPSLLTLSNRQSVIQIVDVIQYPEIETTYQGLGA